MSCAEVREMLPSLGGEGASLAVRRHLAGCPGCRAEAARYESLRESLGALRTVAVDPPPELLLTLQGIPGAGSRLDGLRTHVARNRRVYVGGAAAMVATGLAGTLVWRSRRAAPA